MIPRSFASVIRGPLLFTVLIIFIGIPGSLAAETTDMVIENEGWELAASLYSPGDGESRAVVLLFHKAAGERGEYDGMAGKLARAGMTALAVDPRGHGDSTNLDVFDHVVRKNFDLLEGTYRDIEAARRFMAGDPRFKGQPVAIVGASYSGEHAEIIVLEGTGHATRLFNTRPELEDRLVRWLEQALFD